MIVSAATQSRWAKATIRQKEYFANHILPSGELECPHCELPLDTFDHPYYIEWGFVPQTVQKAFGFWVHTVCEQEASR